MTQFSSGEEYNREAETLRRVKHNRKIDAIVKLSLENIFCNCGSNSMIQFRRGSYIVKCNACNEKYRLSV
ncbi:hypothetical protein LCGC14_0345500 [marine sediment metagenome]|uniref:Uncharacterized protein n=1 Tax=marine sediment metagenome TaxID=412755 RepID=A0A0F9TI72_9ZZZZ